MMRKLFQQYGLDYTIQINPMKQELEDTVLTFRDRINQCREHMACCFVVSTSHGHVGTVIGSDGGKTKVDEIILPFGDDKCPKLREKPKVFIIDACRGEEKCELAHQSNARPAGMTEDWSEIKITHESLQQLSERGFPAGVILLGKFTR